MGAYTRDQRMLTAELNCRKFAHTHLRAFLCQEPIRQLGNIDKFLAALV
jgi:hypothetical protein